MNHESILSGKRRAVNLSLDSGLVEAAKAAGVNISQISEAALQTAIKAERDRRWKEENREAMEGWNRWVQKNGLPLEKYRLF